MVPMKKRNVKCVLQFINSKIKRAKREIRESHGNVEKQASLQKYRYFLTREARECHLRLAYLNNTPYACAERKTKKPVPQFEDDKMRSWTQIKNETHSSVEYSLTG